jgi:signal transduction histidine kinase
MTLDQQDRLWITSSDGALVCFDMSGQKVHHLNMHNGLPSNSVSTITSTRDGFIWATSGNTLVRIDPDDFSIRWLNASNGLYFFEDSEFFEGEYNQLYIYLGTIVSKVNTHRLLSAIQKPVIRITGIKTIPYHYEETQIASLPSIALDYKHNSITFTYSATAIRYTDQYQFAYRLYHQDTNWIEAGNTRSVTFANLDDGEYRFDVKAAGPDKIWGPVKSFPFSITPPFWEKWWFYALCGSMAIAGGFSVYRYQLNKALEMHKVRSRISRDLHDEVGSTLGSISLLNEMAWRKQSKLEQPDELHEKISYNLQKVMDAMDDIIWSINPRNDDLNNMALRFSEVASMLLEPAEIKYDILIDEDLKGYQLPMERRRNVYLIYKEALHNIVKYAHCDEVKINFNINNKSLRLSVTDNGIGFKRDAQITRNGLHNMEERAKAVRGHIDIKSRENEGTSVVLSVPLV